jgi:GTPase Era involved in 16S rRNA processing
MNHNKVLEFVIVGHPNEGKSSVVSTLSEDDSVSVSPFPGETKICRTYPVIADGKTVLNFTDTPGFEHPKLMLEWMKNYTGPDDKIVEAFRNAHLGNETFEDECELLMPIVRGAGIIYVADGSRPVRNDDRAEMEILRMTGRPRMAILNCKEYETDFLEHWKNELRKHFNSVRVFNAHKATYSERIALLESLKSIDQDWQKYLEIVISAFKEDWERRNMQTAATICDMLKESLRLSVSEHFTDKSQEKYVRQKLEKEYIKHIESIEKSGCQKIRKLFRHNIFNYDFPPDSIMNEPIFSQKTWHFLGLKPLQLALAGGIAGGAVGAAIDVLALAGASMGLFVTAGTLIGAGSALVGGKRMSSSKMHGLKLGGYEMKMGPNENIQFMYILLDRALIFYSHIINWAHGRRDYPQSQNNVDNSKKGFTTEWDMESRKICQNFFKDIGSGDEQWSRNALTEMIRNVLHTISHSERRYGLIMKNI